MVDKADFIYLGVHGRVLTSQGPTAATAAETNPLNLITTTFEPLTLRLTCDRDSFKVSTHSFPFHSVPIDTSAFVIILGHSIQPAHSLPGGLSCALTNCLARSWGTS
jgi:hypothetical protein